jgi:signal recognition particle GTPase
MKNIFRVSFLKNIYAILLLSFFIYGDYVFSQDIINLKNNQNEKILNCENFQGFEKVKCYKSIKAIERCSKLEKGDKKDRCYLDYLNEKSNINNIYQECSKYKNKLFKLCLKNKEEVLLGYFRLYLLEILHKLKIKIENTQNKITKKTVDYILKSSQAAKENLNKIKNLKDAENIIEELRENLKKSSLENKIKSEILEEINYLKTIIKNSIKD